MIEIEDVTVRRGDRVVLDHVSLTIPASGLLSVLGPSGTGKTTLLSVMAGLLPQDGGTVMVDDEPIDDLPAHRRSMAMVFQDSRLFPNMDVLANICFPLRMRGVARAERVRRGRELLARVHLGGLDHRRPSQLSGGQRQRVALARALAGDPSVVLLDEPFSGLDESLRDDMRHLVLELQGERAIPMVMVTHDAMEALIMSDEVAYLDGGHVVAQGTAAEVLLAPGSPAGASFPSTCALEGDARGGTFTVGRLRVAAPQVADGPAVLLRFHDGTVSIQGRGGERP